MPLMQNMKSIQPVGGSNVNFCLLSASRSLKLETTSVVGWISIISMTYVSQDTNLKSRTTTVEDIVKYVLIN